MTWQGSQINSASGVLTYEAMKRVIDRAIYGKYINEFNFGFNRQDNKYYLIYELPYSHLNVIEYI